jgi:hypothetical protein
MLSFNWPQNPAVVVHYHQHLNPCDKGKYDTTYRLDCLPWLMTEVLNTYLPNWRFAVAGEEIYHPQV